MAEYIFTSEERFRGAFEAGLERLLATEELGPFILVAANATFDPAIYARTRGALASLFDTLHRRYRGAIAEGRPVPGAEDDVAVFLRMACIGFEGLRPTERRTGGPWELQFNHLRSFRPRRNAGASPTGIARPFDENGFHFNKPFLQKEAVWRGELAGRSATLFYNKFPFADLHGLLVPDPERRLPQWLTEEHHRYIWRLGERLANDLEGVGFGYNAYGAYASVNHLHFHMFVRPQPLPLADPRWVHNGGNEAYPTPCLAFEEAESAWEAITQLHEQGVAYNLIYLPGRLYCLPRKRQGTYAHAPWSGGFAWHEMAGGIVTANRDDYEHLAASDVSRELAKLAPTTDQAALTTAVNG